MKAAKKSTVAAITERYFEEKSCKLNLFTN
jgi:hypothetical protein